jgi:hypothetical protein
VLRCKFRSPMYNVFPSLLETHNRYPSFGNCTLNPDSSVKLRIPEASWNAGVAMASNCEISKSFRAYALRCHKL